MLPGAEVKPASQGLHDALSAAGIESAAQSWHEIAPASLIWLAEHEWQTPLSSAKFPAVQIASQVSKGYKSLRSQHITPNEQIGKSRTAFDVDPGAQGLHDDEPASEIVPTAQDAQEVAPAAL